MRFDLSDEEWALIEPLLPKSRKNAQVDDGKILNAIFYVLRAGMPWPDLPARYGPLHDGMQSLNLSVSPRDLEAGFRPAGIAVAR